LTFIFHVFPDLSCAVAEVPVVMILSGLECCGVSFGGCSILTVGALALCTVVCADIAVAMLQAVFFEVRGCVQDCNEDGSGGYKAAKSLMTPRLSQRARCECAQGNRLEGADVA